MQPDQLRQLDQDLLWNMTPDMPLLRFRGPQMFFIWDDMCTHATFHKWGIYGAEDTNIVNYRAMTQEKLFPLFSNNSGQFGDRGFVCRKMQPMNKMDNQDLKDIGSIRNHHIGGKIVSCSLSAITTLDQVYGNTFNRYRVKVPIYTNQYSRSETVMCWMYFADPSMMFKYDPHEQVNRLVSGFNPKQAQLNYSSPDQFIWEKQY